MDKPKAIIIGAGFTGVATAIDLALRGFDVTVVERGPIANGTSGRTHGLLHCGGRYAVKDHESAIECIDENIILRKIVPEVIEPNGGMFIALTEGDLQYGEEWIEGCEACHIPIEELKPQEALRLEPNINPKLLAAFAVPDGTFDPLRLALAFAATAKANGARFRLYNEVQDFILDGLGNVIGVKVLDKTNDTKLELRSDIVVVGNIGTAGTGAFGVSFRLSDALSLSFSCRADSGLAPGESFVCAGDAALPVGVSAGSYVTRAVVDADGEVDESNEENNFRYADGGSTVLTVFAAAAPVSTTLFVPVVVSSAGLNGSFFTSELTLTNRGPRPATLTFSYTASIGTGSGSATHELPAGRQRVIPDALACLRSRGVPLPDAGNLGGTLAIRFDGLADPSDAGAIVRTATAVTEGRAGLAYTGMRREDLATDRVVVFGLRQNDTDRSNLALQHAGGPGSGEIVLEVTL